MRLSWPAMWRVCKVILTGLILVSVLWQFARVLRSPELWQTPFHLRWHWAVLAGLLYLLGLGCSATFWYYLLRSLGQQPTLVGTVRAFYVGQLGRYVPGKIVGIVFRAGLLQGAGVSKSVAILTIIYEALTTLTAGALLAALLLPWQMSDHAGLRWQIPGLLALVGLPLMPRIFNRLIRKFAKPFAETEAPVPGLRSSTLASGLGITACGWALQGASLWAMLQALLPQMQPWGWEKWAHYSAILALATLVGFLVVTVPSGLGVRELLLQQFLARDLVPVLGADQALTMSVVSVLLLRLVWTLAEVSAAGMLYWAGSGATSNPVPESIPKGKGTINGSASPLSWTGERTNKEPSGPTSGRE